MSQNNWPFIINVGNSIIGVTVLAMPFCFQACGIILGTLLLMFATWLTVVSCQLLMKAGVTARRRSYSLLAMFTHGAFGKLIVEVGMIGLQLGTLIAQVVIIGDLGPAIVSKATGLPNSDNLRTGLIVFLCLFIGLPMGLLKDVRTLSNTSSMCMAFYASFTIYIVILSLPNLVAGDWYNRVNFWRMEGFFQCLPIFSFAFGCQTQLFIVYDALSEPSLKRINSIVGSAVNMCSVTYLLVGFFGYVAFCNAGDLSGDIINHFKQNTLCDVIKLLFVFSIAVTIPLIVFPCRASLFTLFFHHKQREDVPGSGKIPELHFKVITVVIIVGSMVTGILIPNIEFVLGINGATMGTLICYIFPALFFLSVMSDKAEGLFTGKVVLALGLTIMVASTYTILATESTEVRVDPLDTVESNPVIDVSKMEETKKFIENIKGEVAAANRSKVKEQQGDTQERHEPPIPQAPDDNVPVNKEAEDKLVQIPDNDLKDQIDKNKQSIENQKHVDTVVKTLDKEKVIPKEDNLVQDKIEDKDKLKEAEKKQNEILAKLEQQQEQQEKLIQEQKEILEQLKEHKDSHKDDEPAVNQGHKQIPNNMNPNQILVNDPSLHLTGNNDQIEQKKLVDLQVPKQNQVDGIPVVQQNHKDGEHIQVPQQHNEQDGAHLGQLKEQDGIQVGLLNQQGGVQVAQQNLQDSGIQIAQQNLKDGIQVGQQIVQGALLQNQEAGIQVPQQNLQDGVQKLQQNQAGGQVPQLAQIYQKNQQNNLNFGDQLQFQKVQVPESGQDVKQNVVQMKLADGLHQKQQDKVDRQLNIKNNHVVDNMHQLDDRNLNVENLVKHNNRVKRESGLLVNEGDNVQRTDTLSDNDMNANNAAKDVGSKDNTTENTDKNVVPIETDRSNTDLDNKDLEVIVANKENNGQRELKELKAAVGVAQYDDGSYIDEIINGLKKP